MSLTSYSPTFKRSWRCDTSGTCVLARCCWSGSGILERGRWGRWAGPFYSCSVWADGGRMNLNFVMFGSLSELARGVLRDIDWVHGSYGLRVEKVRLQVTRLATCMRQNRGRRLRHARRPGTRGSRVAMISAAMFQDVRYPKSVFFKKARFRVGQGRRRAKQAIYSGLHNERDKRYPSSTPGKHPMELTSGHQPGDSRRETFAKPR